MQGQQKVPLRPLVTKKVVDIGEGQNLETTETRDIQAYLRDSVGLVPDYHDNQVFLDSQCT